jgi:hypothetical protein
MEEKRNAYRVLVGKPEGKRPLTSQRRRGENNFKILVKRDWEGMDWIGLAEDKDRWRSL